GSFPDNSSFQISGNSLQSAVSFNFEVKNTYTICVRTTDNGSPNLSFDKQFTININDVNDAPVDGNESVSAVGNTLLEYGSVPSPSSAAKKVVAGNLLANATDEDQPPQTLSISASDTTSAQGGSVSVSSSGAFSYVPPAGFTGTDTFNYTVSDGNGGTDNSTVTVTVASRVWYVKNNATAGGTGRSTDPFDTLAEADTAANATGDITYVYKGDGTTTGLTGGFSLLANQQLLGEPVDLVVGADTLATGTPANRPSLSGTVTLASGSRVEAVDIAGSGGPAISGIQSGGSDVTNVNLSGGAGGVSLTSTAAGTFNFTNFTITTTGGTGFFVNSPGFSPTINVGSASTENVSATGGPAVDVRNVNGASSLAFDAVSSTNSSGAGINLDTNGTATFSASSGTISGAAGNAADINGGSGNVTYPGTLGNGSGNTADITGRTGGAISLSGDINDTNDAGGGITMSGNTGGSTTFSGTTKTLNTGASAAFSSTGSGQTITFSNGGLNIDTTSGAGFSATGGGTVNVTGTANTIDTTTGTALTVSSTNIGASGLTFQSISSNGAAKGIVLDTTSASGSLVVTGNGGTCTNADTSGCSGGTIANGTGADDSSASPVGTGIVLNSTTSPSFARMWLHDFTNYAIRGTSLAGFTMANTVINGTNGNNGTDPLNDSSVYINNLTGSATVSNSDVRGGYENNFSVVNSSGSLDRITMSSDTFGDNNATNGNDAVQIESTATASALKATIQNSTFTAAEGDLIDYSHGGSGLGDLVITGNAFSNNHPGIATGGGGLTLSNEGTSGATTMSITSNTFRDAVGPGVLIVKTTGTSIQTGTFSGNTIGVSGVANSGSSEGSALKLQTAGQGSLNWTVTNNIIHGYNNNGIEVLAGGGATLQSGAVNMTITGNSIDQPGTTAGTLSIPKNGIHFNIGTVPGDTYQACAVIGGAGALANSISTSGKDGVPPTGLGDIDFRLRQRQATTIRLPGYAGANNDNTAVQNFVAGNNGGNGAPVGLASNTVPTGGGFIGSGTTCP
ncbi:MAG TPA: Ig-like domain-containing protein, partial [Polyangia bacterium]|nr:Ig-like domain-containing protein [Polyangia bacterium]